MDLPGKYLPTYSLLSVYKIISLCSPAIPNMQSYANINEKENLRATDNMSPGTPLEYSINKQTQILFLLCLKELFNCCPRAVNNECRKEEAGPRLCS